MTEKDPLQTIKEALNDPIETIQPFEFDNDSIARTMIARNSPIIYPPYYATRSRSTLKDELAITKTSETE